MPYPEPPLPVDYIPHVTPDHPNPIIAAWQAHIDAGRLGTTPPMSAAVHASILAAEAIVRRPRSIW